MLLVVAAMAIGCSPATSAGAAADDKAKVGVEAPAKAAAADSTSSVASPTVTPDIAITDTQPDSFDGKKSRRGRAHIRMGDDDFDSFNEALHTAPWVVGLAFLVAGSILLTPVFLLIGIIWYKLRKTRMQNETVLQLAERGAMAPAQAADAVMSGVTPEAAVASTAASSGIASSAAPVYQQAVIARRRAVWSDLRKGVILMAVGLSFVFYSMLDSGSANWLGLVLMFLGVAYILLWWFEDRHLQRREAGVDVGKS